MARPLKSGLDYFPMGVDFFDSDAMVCVEAEFGLHGPAVALRLLAAIYRQGYYIEWNEVVRLRLVRQIAGMGPERLEQIVGALVRWGFFSEEMFGKYGVLTSLEIQECFFAATRKRARRTSELPYLLVPEGKMSVSDAKNPVEMPIISAVTPQSKVKKKINKTTSSDEDVEREEKNIPPSPPEADCNGRFREDFLRASLEEQQWVSAMATALNLESDKIGQLLQTKFRNHCIREGKTHRSLQDFKSHFNRWAQRQDFGSATAKNNNTNNHKNTRYEHHTAENRTYASRPYGGLEARMPLLPDCGIIR